MSTGLHSSPVILARQDAGHGCIISGCFKDILKIWAEPCHCTDHGTEPAGASHSHTLHQAAGTCIGTQEPDSCTNVSHGAGHRQALDTCMHGHSEQCLLRMSLLTLSRWQQQPPTLWCICPGFTISPQREDATKHSILQVTHSLICSWSGISSGSPQILYICLGAVGQLFIKCSIFTKSCITLVRFQLPFSATCVL